MQLKNKVLVMLGVGALVYAINGIGCAEAYRGGYDDYRNPPPPRHQHDDRWDRHRDAPPRYHDERWDRGRDQDRDYDRNYDRGGHDRDYRRDGGRWEPPDSSTRVNLDTRQRWLMERMGAATMLFSSAMTDVEEALAVDSSLLAEQQLILNNLKSEKFNREYIRKAAAGTVPAEAIQNAAQQRLQTADSQQLAEINGKIRRAENKRRAAELLNVLAYKEAVMMLGDMSEYGIGGFLTVLDTASFIKDVCAAQNKQTKALKEAINTYKASQNIKPPSDDEAKQVADEWLKQ